jgi:mono/diheme cytochrome c family protein
MNEEEKRQVLQEYQEAKQESGEYFFPDAIFHDAVVALIVFLVLAALAIFIGAPLEARANPADTTYTPRPEWYFLFLYQLLKYFPGQLEVIGVFVIPTLVILLLLALPFLDRKRRRHFTHRPIVIGGAALISLGILTLTGLALSAAPPPEQQVGGDQTAALYTENCAPCHGPSIQVAPGTNLHEIIASGRHEEGMPAWNADLTTNEIDALAGFILSPGGSQLFTDNCAACHDLSELVASDPLELRNALDQGPEYPPHEGADVPLWKETLSVEQRTNLLNFLVAPDGQRLFAINCAPCHGKSVSVTGDESKLRSIISQGGLHLEMPPWRERLSESEIDALAAYVVDPSGSPDAADLFLQNCSGCHGDRIPAAADVGQAEAIIAGGGPHETMPVWGDILTPEQLDALVTYTLQAASGTPVEEGGRLFAQYCATCHGELGEGGPNPTRPDDIIAPISSAEYLKTRDDATLRAVISQGQPNFGMFPFSTAFGGPLDDVDIDAIVAFIRSWEQNPPVELPPEVVGTEPTLSGPDIYRSVCAQCHGENGEGGIGPAFADPQFQAQWTDQEIFDAINLGHEATAMIAWGEILSAEQINELVLYIRQLGSGLEGTPAVAPSFSRDILPLFAEECATCHGSMGGWDSTSYQAVMETGTNAPVVIPGNAENSLLAQKLQGTQTLGGPMPPGGELSDAEVRLVVDWINAGAPDN